MAVESFLNWLITQHFTHLIFLEKTETMAHQALMDTQTYQSLLLRLRLQMALQKTSV